MFQSLPEFLNAFSKPDKIIQEVNDYTEKNEPDFKNKYGGGANLGIEFHHNIQETVTKIMELQSLSEEERSRFEPHYKHILFGKLLNNLDAHAVIKKDGNLKNTDVAQHFFDNEFTPLLDDAKRLNELFDKSIYKPL